MEFHNHSTTLPPYHDASVDTTCPPLPKNMHKTPRELIKKIDLRPEEVLDSYCIIMRDLKPKTNLNKEYAVFNLLAKLSAQVACVDDLTWAQALELHFKHSMFKEKSRRVARNFIFRKFFCQWLERYLQRRSNAKLVFQQ